MLVSHGIIFVVLDVVIDVVVMGIAIVILKSVLSL